MNAHTPGPWATRVTQPYVKDEGGRIAIDMPEWSEGATAYMHCSDGSQEVGMANARLIAAAPELLAALRVMVERYTSLVNCGDCGNWDPESEEQVLAARTAIAKATQP